MTGLDPTQFRELIVRPTLEDLGLYSVAAENLVFGTAAHESKLRYLKQTPTGPALGLYQIEPATHEDLWQSTLQYQPTYRDRLHQLLAPSPGIEEQLITNLAYATGVCRLLYWRHPQPLPDANDIPGLAAYWKAHYNANGKGTVGEWANDYQGAQP